MFRRFLNESFPKQFISIKLMLMIILAILFESAASCFVVPAWLRITLHTFCHIADWLLANFSWMNIFTIPLQLAMTILLIFAGILERHFDMTSTEAKPVINKTKSLKSCDKGRHKKNCRKSENCIDYLTPPPSTERVKNKRMKYQ